jgi:tetratricopeptide (TPR) repeat protein
MVLPGRGADDVPPVTARRRFPWPWIGVGSAVAVVVFLWVLFGDGDRARREAERLTNEGELLLENDDLDGAIGSFEEARAADSDYARAWSNLGLAWMAKWRRTGNGAARDSAYESLTGAARLDPESAVIRSNLGQLLVQMGISEEVAERKMGFFEAARETLLRATILDEANAGAHANLASALDELGEDRDAIREYRQALRHAAPEDTLLRISCLNNLGYLLATTDPVNPDSAITVLEEGIVLNSDLPGLWKNLGLSYETLWWTDQDLEWLDAADSTYRRALEIDPSLKEALRGQERVAAAGRASN